MRRERHEPVERRERHREEVGDEAGGAPALHPEGEAAVAGLVLARREPGEDRGEDDPDGEVDRRAGQERRRVQPRLLVREDRVGRDDLAVRPLVEGVGAEGDRQERDGREAERQRARRGLEDPADHDAPGPARDVVEEQDAEGARPTRPSIHM